MLHRTSRQNARLLLVFHIGKTGLLGPIAHLLVDLDTVSVQETVLKDKIHVRQHSEGPVIC